MAAFANHRMQCAPCDCGLADLLLGFLESRQTGPAASVAVMRAGTDRGISSSPTRTELAPVLRWRVLIEHAQATREFQATFLSEYVGTCNHTHGTRTCGVCCEKRYPEDGLVKPCAIPSALGFLNENVGMDHQNDPEAPVDRRPDGRDSGAEHLVAPAPRSLARRRHSTRAQRRATIGAWTIRAATMRGPNPARTGPTLPACGAPSCCPSRPRGSLRPC